MSSSVLMTPKRGSVGGVGSPSGGAASARPIDDGPIPEFALLIETTAPDAWQRRTGAFQSLVQAIPRGSQYIQHQRQPLWYNTPATLRHLAYPVSELLKDARSTVVKRTCESLTILFNRCQQDARFLFKDLMSTILAVHAQTVQVIRAAVQGMVMEAIPEVPCKMVMPLWMDRLKVDKSRTVREACVLYLGQALQCWTEEGYLTEEIWLQVGGTLIKSLRDPSPQVRSYAKNVLEVMQQAQRPYWDRLVNDPDGPAGKDVKLQRWLQSVGQTTATTTANNQGANTPSNWPDAEELSVASRISYNSDTRFATRSYTPSSNTAGHRLSAPSPRKGFFSGSNSYHHPTSGTNHHYGNQQFFLDDEEHRVPASISVTTPSTKIHNNNNTSSRNGNSGNKNGTTGGGLGPPLRPRSRDSSPSHGRGTPPRPPPISTSSLMMSLGLSKGSSHGSTTAGSNHTTSLFLDTIQDNSDKPIDDDILLDAMMQDSLSPRFPADLMEAATTTFRSSSTERKSGDASMRGKERSDNLTDRTDGESRELDRKNNTNGKTSSSSASPSSSKHQRPPAIITASTAETTPTSSEDAAEDHPPQPHQQDSMTGRDIEVMRSKPTMENITNNANTDTDSARKSSSTHSSGGGGGSGIYKHARSPSEGPFIVSMQKLKEHALKRRSRNSILIQERLRMSSSNVGTDDGSIEGGDRRSASVNGGGTGSDSETSQRRRSATGMTAAGANVNAPSSRSSSPIITRKPSESENVRPPLPMVVPSAPEHMVIAIRLLRAHKLHVDRIMETLKMEMDALRDFDRLLEQAGRPTEEEVLDYFESVGLCLDQRSQASARLQLELDRISRGEPAPPDTEE